MTPAIVTKIRRDIEGLLQDEAQTDPKAQAAIDKLVEEIGLLSEKHNCPAGLASVTVVGVETGSRKLLDSMDILMGIVPQVILSSLFNGPQECLKGMLLFSLVNLMADHKMSGPELRVYTDMLITRMERPPAGASDQTQVA